VPPIWAALLILIPGKVDLGVMGNSYKGYGARRKTKRLYFVATPLLLMLLAGSILSAFTYKSYKASYASAMNTAQQAEQHLRNAESLLLALSKNPFDASSVQQAQQQFSGAASNFTQLQASLQSLPGIATSIPVYGSRLNAAQHLVPLALDLSQAGITGCTIMETLISAFHDPLKAHGSGLTQANLNSIKQDFQQVQQLINESIGQADQLTPADISFEPHLATLFATFQNEIPKIQTWMASISNFLSVAPAILGIGSPTNYLIEVLDSTELRPGGGFIGNYGIATVSNGRLISTHITDVDLLDLPFETSNPPHTIPYPPQYVWFSHFLAHGGWSFRDSNLDADFPTSARNGETNYKIEGGKVPVQGVIAITPWLIQHVLQITGPITVPEYNEVVDAQNLIYEIHFHQLGAAGEGPGYIPAPGGHSSLRKQFTELLAEQVFARIHQFSSSDLSKFLQLLVTSIHTKDIQVYLNSSAAENLLHLAHLDAAIQAPQGDSFFVVDANVSGSKANSFITSSMQDDVTVDSQGDVLHHIVLHYAWLIPGNDFGNPIYTDYIRVYVPPGSILYSANGWTPQGTSQKFGREVWAGYFHFSFGQTHSITLSWMVHNAVQKTGNTCHYQELIQKQAGDQWSANQFISLPSSAVISSTTGPLREKGKSQAALNQAISEDTTVGINFTCG
jgi:hypothetical protein